MIFNGQKFVIVKFTLVLAYIDTQIEIHKPTYTPHTLNLAYLLQITGELLNQSIHPPFLTHGNVFGILSILFSPQNDINRGQ